MKELTIVVRVGKEVYGHGCCACDVFVTENCTFSIDEHILNCLYYVNHNRSLDNWLELENVSGSIAIAICKRIYEELKQEKEKEYESIPY